MQTKISLEKFEIGKRLYQNCPKKKGQKLLILLLVKENCETRPTACYARAAANGPNGPVTLLSVHRPVAELGFARGRPFVSDGSPR